MIVVRVEMWPQGDKTRAYPLALMTMTNDGTGSKTEGNYDVALSHAGIHYPPKDAPPDKVVWKIGRVEGFPRKHSPYHLILRALQACGIGTKHKAWRD